MSDADRASFNRRALLRAGAVAGLAFAASRGSASARAARPLKIGVIGSGHIGSTVGSLWVKAGHPVMFSSRHPEELASLVQGLGALAKAGHGCRGGRVRRRRSSSPCPTAPIRRSARTTAASLRARWCSMPATRSRRATARSSTEVQEEGIGVTSAKYLPGATDRARVQHAWATSSSPPRPIAPATAWRFRWPATTRMR